MNEYSIKHLLLNTPLAKIDAKLLLRYVLGFSNVELIINENYQLTSKQYNRYIKLCKTRLTGMPMAYILGYKEFYSHQFKVTPATLIPRPETELLVDAVLKLARPEDKILELGTGSGCIAISLKLKNQALDIAATDKYPETLAVAIDNATNLDATIKFIQSDWFSEVRDKYNIIVSNPPYIKLDDEHLSALRFEPRLALTARDNGMSDIQQIISAAPEYLKNKGYLLLEHGYNQGRATVALMLNSGFADVRTIHDYANLERITLGRFKA